MKKIIISFFLGLIGSGILLYVGLQHNPQGEFFSEEGIDYLYILKFLSVNILIITTVAYLIIWVINIFWRIWISNTKQ
jgi:hypothetical protein